GRAGPARALGHPGAHGPAVLSHRRRGTRATLRALRPALPVAEQPQQAVARRRLDAVLAEVPQRADGLTHLLQVNAAAGAVIQVPLKARAISRREASLQVLGDQLHQLSAAQVV